MGKQVFVRIDAFFAVFKLQPRNAQIVDLILLRGCQVSFQINKAAPAGELFVNAVVFQLRQNPDQFFGCFLGFSTLRGLAYRLTVGSEVAMMVPLRSMMSARRMGFWA